MKLASKAWIMIHNIPTTTVHFIFSHWSILPTWWTTSNWWTELPSWKRFAPSALHNSAVCNELKLKRSEACGANLADCKYVEHSRRIKCIKCKPLQHYGMTGKFSRQYFSNVKSTGDPLLQSIQSSEYKEKFDKDQVPFESETAFC